MQEVTTSLGHQPKGRWEFDASVTSCFEDMLRRSIPQYDVMRQACFDLACDFRRQGTQIIDLGCSQGDALVPLVDRYGATNQFIGCDISGPMLESARARFAGMIRAKVVDIRNCDLRREYPAARASVTFSVLTLQFTPIEYRQKILRSAWENTGDGGAFILVEKVLGADFATDEMLVRRYYQHKEASGYTREEIDRKRLALEGVLVPVTARWNEEMLHAAGFPRVECFWRWMNFAGWIAVK
ncbi:MAG: methyltransferase domain-containing protein [Phaeospirillum sp.]|nr:methyltransferase domain-containing protein [Phaeospirillum sp.]